MGLCHCCGDEIKSRKGFFCRKPKCQEAYTRHRAEVKARYALAVKEGRIKPVKQPPRNRIQGYETEADKVPNGWLCQKCKKPLTGARRFNCPDCEYILVNRNVLDNDYIYGTEFNMQEIREFARKPLPWERQEHWEKQEHWEPQERRV